MKKSKLDGFINRYNLGGEIESVMVKSDGSELSVKMISDDKTLLGTVSLKDADFPAGEFGIYTTSQLKGLLSVLDENIKAEEVTGAIKFSDNGNIDSINIKFTSEFTLGNSPWDPRESINHSQEDAKRYLRDFDDTLDGIPWGFVDMIKEDCERMTRNTNIDLAIMKKFRENENKEKLKKIHDTLHLLHSVCYNAREHAWERVQKGKQLDDVKEKLDKLFHASTVKINEYVDKLQTLIHEL